MSSERNATFWMPNQHKVSGFESQWYKEVVSKDKRDYSMDGELKGDCEKVVGNHLLLAGPIIDGYLQEIGLAISAKLSRGSLTGLAPPVTIFLPKQVMGMLASLCCSYGADIKNICHGRKQTSL